MDLIPQDGTRRKSALVARATICLSMSERRQSRRSPLRDVAVTVTAAEFRVDADRLSAVCRVTHRLAPARHRPSPERRRKLCLHVASKNVVKDWSTQCEDVANISHDTNLHISENGVRVSRSRPQAVAYDRLPVRHDDEGPSPMLTDPRAFGVPLPRSGPTPARHWQSRCLQHARWTAPRHFDCAGPVPLRDRLQRT